MKSGNRHREWRRRKHNKVPVLGAALFSCFFGEGRNDWLYNVFAYLFCEGLVLLDLVAVVSVCSERSAFLQLVSTTEFNAYGLLPGGVASLLPIFPKHTLLQNRTLAIHMPTPMLSLLTRPLYFPLL